MADLREFAENIWVVDGPDVRDLMMFTTRMVVVKLPDNRIWVSSPVPASFDTLKEITAKGSVKYLVAGTPRHVWRLAAWHTLFPDAELWAARKTPFTLKRAPLDLTGILGDEPPRAWENDFDQLAFKGNPLIEEAFFFHKRSRTLILDDLIQIHPIAKGKPFRNALWRVEGVLSPHGGVALDFRLTFTNRTLARQSLNKLLSWDFEKLIMAHGPCIETDAKAFVERAFRWLI